MPFWIGAIPAISGSLFVVMILPSLARHINGSGTSTPTIYTLLPAAAALGILFQKLLLWAGCRNKAELKRGIWLPWIASLLPLVTLLMPSSRFGMTGSPLGPVKHVLAGSWILGIAIFGWFFLKPLLKEFHPGRLTAGFTILVVLIALVMSIIPPVESDEGDYVFAAIAIAETATTRVDVVFKSGHYIDYYYTSIPGSNRVYQYVYNIYGKPLYRNSLRMIGFPLILAPFVKVASGFETPVVRWFISYIPTMLAYWFLMYAILSWIKDYGESDPYTAVVFGTLTPFIYFATNTQPENWLACLTAWCLLLAMRFHNSETISTEPSPIFAAFVPCGLILMHERMAPVAFAFFLYFLYSTKRKTYFFLWSVGLFLLVLISYFSVHQYALPSGAPHDWSLFHFSFYNIAVAAWAHLFSINIGIFTHLPPLLTVFLAWKMLNRFSIKISLAAFIPYYVMIVFYPRTFDSWPHLRYFVPVLPLFLPAVYMGTKRLLEQKGGQTIMKTMIAIQLLVSWPYLTIPHLWQLNLLSFARMLGFDI